MSCEIVTLPHLFKPRDYQQPALEAFFYKKRRKLFLLYHRRAGKDLTCINILVAAAMQRVGTYLFLLPQQNQARRVIWRGMDGEGIAFLDRIPKALIRKKNNQEMSVELVNGSIIMLGGSNNYNALMGSNPVGIVYSEFPLHTPLARQYLSPILAENKGWEICQGTPRGKNHAYKVYQQALASPDEWFVQRLTVNDTKRHDGTPVITQEDIEIERRGGMSDELIEQEFFCNFMIGMVGAYYTKEIDLAERESRIGHFEIDPKAPVYTFWDIGVHDATAIWWMQPKDGYLHLIYYYEATDQGIEHFIEKLEDVRKMFNIKYHTHYGPHDIANREWGGNARSRLNIAIQKGLTFNVVQATNIEDGIQAVRSIFPKCRFHLKYCELGLDALKEYRRKYDEVNRVFINKPLHDWSSNCFVGETAILTRIGTCRIMDLPQSGEILTLCGWKPYRNPRITRRNAPLVEVTFVGGLSVKCTPDHMFLTESGWKSAESLERGIKIQSSLTTSPNILKDVYIEYGQLKGIWQKAASFFIGMRGKLHLGKYQKDVMFTIKTGISKIIPWITWNVWMLRSICLYPGIKNQKQNLGILARIAERKPRSGTGLQKDDYGIADTPLDQKLGRNGFENLGRAYGARKFLTALSEQMGMSKNSALITAKPLTIESVKRITQVSDVWCLTVPYAEHFSLENGAVVHNCADSFRYFAVKWSDLFTRPNSGPFTYQSGF